MIQARAKLNLFLQVTGRRYDGYHELVSIFQEVSLSDELDILSRKDRRVYVSCPGIPAKDNLVSRVIRAMKPMAGRLSGVHVSIRKRIPVGSGLGGGSSDAAAVIQYLNEVWNCGMDPVGLEEFAARFGSDIPFFLHGKTALVKGRGEQVQPIRTACLPGRIVIVAPPVQVSTARVYGALQLEAGGKVPVDERLDAFVKGDHPLPVRNDLFSAAARIYPELKKIYSAIESTGPDMFHMTGSGSAFWAVYDPNREESAVKKLTNIGQVYIVEAVR